MLKLFKKRDSVVLDEKSQKEVKDLPSDIDIRARLTVINNRMFIVCLIMGLVTVCSIYFQHKASVRADNSIKAAWVKMYPGGTWDIEFNDEERQPEFFQSTVDYLLRNWVARRYSKIPHSVNSDYGYCYDFMSPQLQNDFVSPNGFNAAAKAAEISQCSNCPTIDIQVKDPGIDHYDQDETKFGKYKGTLYRTNVFAVREEKAPDGQVIRSDDIMIPMQWRIKDQEEIQKDKQKLRANPIGLEILAYEILVDTSNQKKGGKSE